MLEGLQLDLMELLPHLFHLVIGSGTRRNRSVEHILPRHIERLAELCLLDDIVLLTLPRAQLLLVGMAHRFVHALPRDFRWSVYNNDPPLGAQLLERIECLQGLDQASL
jgi:hypothetical protein